MTTIAIDAVRRTLHHTVLRRSTPWSDLAGAALLAALLSAAACEAKEFRCAHGDDCSQGYCEASGFCSFDDPDCTSGRRYADHSDPEYASRCVPPSGDSDGEACGPPADKTCDSTCPGRCTDGVCTIACESAAACNEAVLRCPPQIPCAVTCSGQGSCSEVTLDCTDASGCDLECSGLGACANATVICGAGPCAPTCDGLGAGPIDVTCGESCDCDRSCSLGS